MWLFITEQIRILNITYALYTLTVSMSRTKVKGLFTNISFPFVMEYV